VIDAAGVEMRRADEGGLVAGDERQMRGASDAAAICGAVKAAARKNRLIRFAAISNSHLRVSSPRSVERPTRKGDDALVILGAEHTV